jgi:hypothetical protein
MTDTNATIARWFAELRTTAGSALGAAAWLAPQPAVAAAASLHGDPRFECVVARLCDMSSGRTS